MRQDKARFFRINLIYLVDKPVYMVDNRATIKVSSDNLEALKKCPGDSMDDKLSNLLKGNKVTENAGLTEAQIKLINSMIEDAIFKAAHPY